ncbi:lysine exporter LysO family protein [Thermaerobacter subterraneus]|uniref:Membrane protein n=1 Tax=Thermaerobacter subterraneus DSM 13965 TaxID=867903 RepID=K6QEF0_9FIRM|nr:lysine exporter LysO family protein [Thermaerobacter subterraneus]EKP95206.1 putative membrane protein [Thermaerobacter subterraneus DSM 13965]
MTAVLVALAAGMAAGLSGLGGLLPAAWWDAASRWTLRALLFLMGLRLGLDPQVGSGLARLGARAAAFAVATAGGALLAGLLGSALGAAWRARTAFRQGAPSARRRRAPGTWCRRIRMAWWQGTPITRRLGSRAAGGAGEVTGRTRQGPITLSGGTAGPHLLPSDPVPRGSLGPETPRIRPDPARHDPAAGDPATAAGGPGRSGEALRLSAAAVLAVAGGWLAGAVFVHWLGGLPGGSVGAAVAGEAAAMAGGLEAPEAPVEAPVAPVEAPVEAPASGGTGGVAGGPEGSAPLVAAAGRLAAAGSGYALLLLMALYGYEFGRQWPATRESLRAVRGKALLLPLLGAAGSLAGGWLAGRLTGEPPALALAVAAAFGWYSMAGVLVAQLWGPAAGALAFLANVMRELLTVVAVPFLARLAGRRSWLAVLPGGATTMDTTLPVIAAAARDAGTTALAFVHGLILTLLAPALISWLASL